MIHFLFLHSKYGKTRLSKWYHKPRPGTERSSYTQREKARIVRQVVDAVLVQSQAKNACNFLDYATGAGEEVRIVFKRYASLYFIVGIDRDDNELLALTFIQMYVEALDRYFSNVCELDLVFNFHMAYWLLDEIVLGGNIQEPRKGIVLAVSARQLAPPWGGKGGGGGGGD